MKRSLLVAASAILVAAAGCLNGADDGQEPGPYDPATGLWTHVVDGMRITWAPGAVSVLENAGDAPVDVALPAGTLLLEGPAGGPYKVAAWTDAAVGPLQRVLFLPSPGRATLELSVDGHEASLPAVGAPRGPWNQAVSGEDVWAAMDVQRREFPHRTPGEPAYGAAITYFAEAFEALGYEVEVDPYGTQQLPQDVCVPVPVSGQRACPEGLANVVATKWGAVRPDEVTLIGAHMDVVPGTVEGAFDNTVGTITTLALAEALAPFELERTVRFALWGGEESGLLGSSFWLQTHPEARAQVNPYWNLDVVGLGWPAPVTTAPDAHVFSAGPDDAGSGGQLLGDAMLARLRDIQEDWLAFPTTVETQDGQKDVFRYQVTASGVNTPPPGSTSVGFSASDHTVFQSAGIPSYAAHHGGPYPPGIHNPADTLDNMTRYAYFGTDMTMDGPWPDAATREAGVDAFARSVETVMWFPFYYVLLTDAGIQEPAAIGR